ncbi:hypothetical protein RRG08_057183 [Elysia crispata]|uniref:Uncharacterized protein n=1 Tax=Elysia crispata TaxID=231223 RepID=A0AAE0XWP4_9GAST|nr:hypothetical protein RRG08_057183 [Elysia crispata]
MTAHHKGFYTRNYPQNGIRTATLGFCSFLCGSGELERERGQRGYGAHDTTGGVPLLPPWGRRTWLYFQTDLPPKTIPRCLKQTIKAHQRPRRLICRWGVQSTQACDSTDCRRSRADVVIGISFNVNTDIDGFTRCDPVLYSAVGRVEIDVGGGARGGCRRSRKAGQRMRTCKF